MATNHQQHSSVGQIAQVYQDEGFNGHYDDHGWVTDGQGMNGGAEVSNTYFGLHRGDLSQPQPMGDSVQMPGARGRSASNAEYIQPTAGTDEIFHGNNSPSHNPLKKYGLWAAGLDIAGMLLKGKK
jgi:hypothetical protein